MQALDDLEDIIADSVNSGNKRQKKNLTEIKENDVNEDRIVYASEKTQAALQQWPDALKAQGELDAQLMEKTLDGI
jgi:hypothetical protein